MKYQKAIYPLIQQTIVVSILFFFMQCQGVGANCLELFQEAKKALKADSIHRAKILFTYAGRCFEEKGDRENWFESIWEVNEALRTSERFGYGEAAKFLDSVLVVEWRKKSQEEEDSWIWSLLQNGNNHKKDGDIQAALKYYQQAISTITKSCKEPSWERCFKVPVIWQYGIAPTQKIYQTLGDHETNLNLLSHELQDSLIAQVDFPQWDLLAKFYVARGITYFNLGMKEDIQKARQSFEKALNVPNISSKMRGIILNNLGRLLKNREILNKAFYLLQEEEDAEIHRSKSILYNAYLYRDQGEIKQAISLAHESLSHLQKEFTYRYNLEYGNGYLLLGELYESEGEYEKAMEFYHRCIKVYCPSFKSRDSISLPPEEALVADRDLVDALEGKARIWSQKGQQFQNVELLSKGIQAHKLALLTEDKLINLSMGQPSQRRSLARRDVIASQALPIIHKQWLLQPNDSLLDLAFSLWKRQDLKSYNLPWPNKICIKNFLRIQGNYLTH